MICFQILFFKTSIFISQSSACPRKHVPTHFVLLCLFQILENKGRYLSYCIFSVACTVKMILWVGFLFVSLAQIVSGTNQTVLILATK